MEWKNAFQTGIQKNVTNHEDVLAKAYELGMNL